MEDVKAAKHPDEPEQEPGAQDPGVKPEPVPELKNINLDEALKVLEKPPPQQYKLELKFPSCNSDGITGKCELTGAAQNKPATVQLRDRAWFLPGNFGAGIFYKYVKLHSLFLKAYCHTLQISHSSIHSYLMF